jgi:hypothetical protein
MRVVSKTALAAVFLALASSKAGAQMFEAVGTRAQGMGGAFVAVADDATASWWNPAGLATGAYLNAVIEKGRTTEPADPEATLDASRTSTGGFAVAFPALGLSYYRLRTSEIAASTVPAADGRQDPGVTRRVARSLRYSQFGSTVGQSLGQHFVIGSTLKLVRAGQMSGVTLDAGGSLDSVDDFSPPVKTRVGLDVGAMASFPSVRVGFTVRNVHQLNIGSDDEPLRLKRRARAGLAVLTGQHGMLSAVTAAADADLTGTDTAFGRVRHVATGVEAWMFGRHLGLRGGITMNSVGELRPVTSLGASVAPKTGFFVDAAWSDGRDGSLRGWTTSLRVSF